MAVTRHIFTRAAAVAIAVGAALLVGGGSSASGGVGDDCAALPLIKVTYLSPTGQVVPHPVAGGGQISVYRTLEGNPITSLDLPAGLDLSSASPQVIHDLGLPPRPHDPTRRSVWEAAFGGASSSSTPTPPCESGNVS